jgi:hypothetical protein
MPPPLVSDSQPIPTLLPINVNDSIRNSSEQTSNVTAPIAPGLRSSYSDAVFANIFSKLDEILDVQILPVDKILNKPTLASSNVQTTFIKKKGYYIVPYDRKFYYFKIGDIHPRGDHLFEMIGKKPATLREGLVIIESDAYYVTHQDLIRGLIRKSRKLKLKKTSLSYDDFESGNICPVGRKIKPSAVNTEIEQTQRSKDAVGEIERLVATSSPGGSSGNKENTEEVSDFPISNFFEGQDRKHGSTSKTPKLDEFEIVNLAFEDEMRSLLHTLSEKEGIEFDEWEVEKTTQPR